MEVDYSTLYITEFDLVTGSQQIKIAILVKFWVFLAVILSLSSYLFPFITFTIWSSNFKVVKQAPGLSREHGTPPFTECGDSLFLTNRKA